MNTSLRTCSRLTCHYLCHNGKWIKYTEKLINGVFCYWHSQHAFTLTLRCWSDAAEASSMAAVVCSLQAPVYYDMYTTCSILSLDRWGCCMLDAPIQTDLHLQQHPFLTWLCFKCKTQVSIKAGEGGGHHMGARRWSQGVRICSTNPYLRVWSMLSAWRRGGVGGIQIPMMCKSPPACVSSGKRVIS